MAVTCCVWVLVFVVFLPTYICHSMPPLRFDLSRTPVEEISVRAHHNQTLRCSGANEFTLMTQLEWYSTSRRKAVLEFSQNSMTIYTDQSRLSLAKDYSLNFHPVLASDTGDYVCIINNRLQPDAVIRLKVLDVPDAPAKPLITDFTSRSCQLSWAPPADSHFSPIKYYLINKRNGEGSAWEDLELQTENNDTNYEVQNLLPYTVYSFRVYAVNDIGRSPPSDPTFYMITLREAPTGRVTITNAKNESSSSVYLSWTAPPEQSVRGEFIGYKITYQRRDGLDEPKVQYVKDASKLHTVISNLQPWTQYYVSVQVSTPAGLGPNASVLIMTDEGIPEEPTNLSVVDYTPTSIYLQWNNPVKRNGIIEGYRVYYTKKNMTDVVPESVPFDEPTVRYNLTKLEPMTEYKISVKAFTQRHEGALSQPITAYTDYPGPSAPQIVALECHQNDSMLIRWQRPEEYYFNIDYYYIFVILGNKLYDNITISTSREHIQTTYILKDLKINTAYKIQVQAATRSNRTGKIITGEVSSPLEMILRKNCEEPMDYLTRATSELGVGILAGMLCASLGLLVTGLGYFVYKKCFRAPYYYLDNPQCTPASLDWNEPPQDPETEPEYTGPIAVKDFPQHVQQLHSDGDIGFSKEYDAIQNDAVNDANSSEHSQHPDNKPKNRYLNIIAYDHTRVRLLNLPGQKVSTYINANYIDGFQVTRAYIGTQGPLPSTFDCFWRMIWEQRVTIIVMITNLVERGRRKCDMYWPKEGTETYGPIQVRLGKEEVTATYTIRTLVLTHLRVRLKEKNGFAEKTVYQYHYTNWPDHGTPDHPLPVIHFVKKSSAANPPDGGPIVVHCSAGVGRTGTYIVLDAMLKQISTRGEVNIFGFLKHIRAQRNFLVQTEEQYIFIHDALVEAIECGETNILREEFPRYVSQLQNLNQEDRNELWKPLEILYGLVTSFVPRDFNLVSANKIVNKGKNRSTLLLPVESARVHLSPKPGEEGSDYVNATWLQGFHSQREFIITQHPMKTTMEDFWQMVWDHSGQLIVMMSDIDNADFDVFWPVESEIIETDTYTCKPTHENANAVYHMREFLLRSVQDDYEFHVKMLHCHNWPQCLKGGLYDMYHLPNFVLGMQKFQNGPIIVVDRFGGTEAATFCALTTFKKHLTYENKVDVYMYSKLYHNKRPGIWRTVNDYLNLHLCVQTLCLPPEPQLEEVVISTPRDMYAINNGGMSSDSVRVPPEGMEADTSAL